MEIERGIKVLRTMVLGMTIECPHRVDSSACAFRKARGIPLVDKAEWVESLSDGEVANLFAAHKDCRAKTNFV